MKMNGTTSAVIESTIRSMPGDIMNPSWRTSLVARAIRSPTRCRLWNVWLLPSRLVKSSSRASRSSRFAITSMLNRAIMSATPRTSTIASSVREMRISAALGSLPVPRTSSNALPVSPGIAPFSNVAVNPAVRKLITSQRNRSRCEMIQRTGLR